MVTWVRNCGLPKLEIQNWKFKTPIRSYELSTSALNLLVKKSHFSLPWPPDSGRHASKSSIWKTTSKQLWQLWIFWQKYLPLGSYFNTLPFHNPVFVELRRIFSHVIPRYSEALLSVSSLVILPEFRTVSEGGIGSTPHSSLTTRIKSLSTSGCPVKLALILILMWGLPVVSAAASIFRCIPKQRWWSINCPIYGGLEGALLKFAATLKKMQEWSFSSTVPYHITSHLIFFLLVSWREHYRPAVWAIHRNTCR